MLRKNYSLKSYNKILLLIILSISFLSCGDNNKSSKDKNIVVNSNPIRKYKKIVSLAPSITEIIFASGYEDKLIGISSYSNYPKEETDKIQKVGSYLDTNLELIIKLNPDLVLILPSHSKVKIDLEKLGIETFTLDNRTIKDILESFYILENKIGYIQNSKEKRISNSKSRAITVADSLSTEIKNEIKKFKKTNNNILNDGFQKVLISAGRDFSQEISSIYAVGTDTFLDNIITSLGLKNVLLGKNSKTKYPKISVEGLVSLNPDIVIELIPDLDEMNVTKEMLINHWKKIFDLMPNLSKKKKRKVIIISGKYSSIPGPRIIKLYKEIRKAF